MSLSDDTGSGRLPTFSGEPAMWATFLTRFVGYCLLTVKGVDTLHALEDNDHDMWYPVQHLNKRLAYSRDVVQRKLVRPKSTPGSENCADALTKSLPTPDFIRHADNLLGITHARTFA